LNFKYLFLKLYPGSLLTHKNELLIQFFINKPVVEAIFVAPAKV